jgi:hypothetical protein
MNNFPLATLEIAFLILLFLSSSFFGQTKAKLESADLELEACKIYKTVLGDEKPLVVLDSISSERFGRNWIFSKRNPKFTIVQPATLKSYKKDSYWCEIKNFVDIEPKKKLIKWDEVESYFEKLKTDDKADLPFIKKYGTDHYYTFSNVGFNKKRDQALLTIRWQSISFLGTEVYYIVLSKINSDWEIIRKEMIWVS